MAAIHASSLISSTLSTCHKRRDHITRAIGLRKGNFSFPKPLTTRDFAKENIVQISCYKTSNGKTTFEKNETNVTDPMAMAKIYAIMEAVSDRIEMHTSVGDQRSDWNSLLLASTNTIILGAATLSGIAAATNAVDTPLLALKISACVLYVAVTGILVIMSITQPSQLAEEQRNATRLFKKLYSEISTIIAIGSPTMANVDYMMDKVLALDRAFPLALLGKMLNKFPSHFAPAVWWPEKTTRASTFFGNNYESFDNGWNEKLEEEMKEIVGILSKNDKADYMRLGEKALKINKLLAISCPLLTCMAAIGSVFIGCPTYGTLGCVTAVAAGAVASVVNTVEHGGQVGMVVELYRGNAGFFKEMEESIESNLKEQVLERRENGELFEMKVALELGRSVLELRDIACKGHNTEEFCSKLF